MDAQLQFVFPLVNGMHARPASFLREKTFKFTSNIRFINQRNNTNVDAKSVVELMSSDTMHNDLCVLLIDGDDAGLAYSSLQEYIQNIFPFVDDSIVSSSINDNLGNNIKPNQNLSSLPRILDNSKAQILHGIPVVAGVSYAKIMLLESDVFAIIPKLTKSFAANEKNTLLAAIANLKQKMHAQIDEIQQQESQQKDLKNILHAHLGILEDESFISGVVANLKTPVGDEQSCAVALHNNYLAFSAKLGAMQNAYLRERVIDIQDLTIRLINEIYGNVINTTVVLTEPTIIVANELTPSQFMSLEKKLLKGLVLKSASSTSHTAILARSFAIPAVSDLGAELNLANYQHHQHKQYAIIDANRGFVIMHPTPEIIDYYQIEIAAEQHILTQNLAYATCSAVTLDQQKVIVASNVASSDEVAEAIKVGADGVGLFRSEFLFMGRNTPPSEEEQYQVYRQAVINANGHAVIVRLLDIGGDKPLSYLNLGKEENPFLGYRAVRFYKEYVDIIHTQLRALLRAAVHGELKIMVPMVSVASEMEWMKEQISIVTKNLSDINTPLGSGTLENVSFKTGVPLGMMIEVPSTAFMLDELALVSDFFSIGTNDLCQYFFACERGNNKIAGLDNPCNPAFLRFLRQITHFCVAKHKFIGMCGEMASNNDYLPLLVGLGLDELSMAPALIAKTKRDILHLDQHKCKELLDQACKLHDAVEVMQLLTTFKGQQALPLLTESLVNIDINNQHQNSKLIAMKRVVNLLKCSERAVSTDTIEEALWQREDTYATGIGYGIAIPHCKTKDVVSSSICVLRVKHGIDWGSIDGEPVYLMLGLIIRDDPNADANEHLKIIAKLSRQLMKEEFRQELFAAQTNNKIVELINEVISPST